MLFKIGDILKGIFIQTATAKKKLKEGANRQQKLIGMVWRMGDIG